MSFMFLWLEQKRIFEMNFGDYFPKPFIFFPCVQISRQSSEQFFENSRNLSAALDFFPIEKAAKIAATMGDRCELGTFKSLTSHEYSATALLI